MRYELLEHTADLMIKAYGDTLEECFENVAFAMADQIVDASSIHLSKEEDIVIEGTDLEELLYDFLSEILFIFDARGLIFGKFNITLLQERLECRAWGEEFNPKKHSPKSDIKAVTYHELQVNEDEPSITVLFDV